LSCLVWPLLPSSVPSADFVFCSFVLFFVITCCYVHLNDANSLWGQLFFADAIAFECASLVQHSLLERLFFVYKTLKVEYVY
jgi:hypothetical protein